MNITGRCVAGCCVLQVCCAVYQWHVPKEKRFWAVVDTHVQCPGVAVCYRCVAPHIIHMYRKRNDSGRLSTRTCNVPVCCSVLCVAGVLRRISFTCTEREMILGGCRYARAMSRHADQTPISPMMQRKWKKKQSSSTVTTSTVCSKVGTRTRAMQVQE